MIQRRPLRRRWIVAGAAAAVVLAFGAWSLFGPEPPAPLEYNIGMVSQGPVESTIEGAGVIGPKEYVDVGAQVSGQLQLLHVEVGDRVQQGDLLAEIDPRSAQSDVDVNQAQLRELQALYQQQTAELNLARAQADRARELLAADAVSEADADAAATQLAVAEATLEELDAQIQRTQYSLEADMTNLGYTKVYAPMNGMVVSITSVEGQMLNANFTAPVILQIADLSLMTISVDIAEAEVPRVRPGTNAYFTTSGDPDRRWPAVVRQILPQPEIVNDVVLYKALLDVQNEGEALLPQMTAQVTFILGQAPNAVRAPIEALQLPEPLRDRVAAEMDEAESQDAELMLVVTENGLEPRIVQVGLVGDTHVEVLSGVEPGERVAMGEMPEETEEQFFGGPFGG
jgi:macrolide-specific efflux system membrane fusion protein